MVMRAVFQFLAKKVEESSSNHYVRFNLKDHLLSYLDDFTFIRNDGDYGQFIVHCYQHWASETLLILIYLSSWTR